MKTKKSKVELTDSKYFNAPLNLIRNGKTHQINKLINNGKIKTFLKQLRIFSKTVNRNSSNIL